MQPLMIQHVFDGQIDSGAFEERVPLFILNCTICYGVGMAQIPH